jgi:hypothetical protein
MLIEDENYWTQRSHDRWLSSIELLVGEKEK